MMPKIFFCYRRNDSSHQAGRLFDHLSQQFGHEQLFKDVDSIPLGEDFRRVLTDRVSHCDVLLALVGDQWLSAANPEGAPRLDDPADFVRIEIETALRCGIPVIPLLVGEAPLPPPERLPEGLRDFAFRHGMPIRPDPDFHRDVEKLVSGILDLTRTAEDWIEAPPEWSSDPQSEPSRQPSNRGFVPNKLVVAFWSLTMIANLALSYFVEQHFDDRMPLSEVANVVICIPYTSLLLARWWSLRRLKSGWRVFLLSWFLTTLLAAAFGLLQGLASQFAWHAGPHSSEDPWLAISLIDALLGMIYGLLGTIKTLLLFRKIRASRGD